MAIPKNEINTKIAVPMDEYQEPYCTRCGTYFNEARGNECSALCSENGKAKQDRVPGSIRIARYGLVGW